MLALPQPPVMLITDPAVSRPLTDIVTEACAAGLRWVCLRDLDAEDDALIKTGKALREITVRYQAQLYVSRNVNIALHINADGVHAASHQDIKYLRQIAGENLIIGQSTHSIDAAKRAVRNGAGYVTLSPVYPSNSKTTDRREALGLMALATAAKELDCPIIALGGINADNIAAVRQTGASGAALIGAITQAADIPQTVTSLIENWTLAV